LQALGLSPDVKYVNDVLIDGFKVSGNLSKKESSGKFSKLSIGIGININT
jgi:biotin-(acetyl-CoA carboxylase) ligase